jgi:peptide/nickel transport system permease protein
MAGGRFHEKHKNQLWYLTLRQFLRHRMAVFGMIMMAVIVFSVVFVDRISPYHPETPDLSNMLAPPSVVHPLGTDELGRDMLTRTLYGGRVSLIVGVFAMLVAVTLGTLVGAVAGYFGGVVDNLLMRFTDFALAFPRIFVLILFAIIFMRPPFSDNPLIVMVFDTLYKMPVARVVFVIGILGWMDVARLVRGSFLEIKNLEYVESARVLGAGTPRIMIRHILPNALGPIIVAASLGVADAIISESGLSFLGLGIQPPTATWGNMLKNALDQIFAAPWTAIVPGFMIFLTVLSINYIGDGLRDAFDPRKINTPARNMIAITCVVNNDVAFGTRFRGEHGLAFFIQTPDAAVLFDTGQSPAGPGAQPEGGRDPPGAGDPRGPQPRPLRPHRRSAPPPGSYAAARQCWHPLRSSRKN